MKFIYGPDSGKLIYSGGRIVLIFSHYNYFIYDLGKTGAHTGDTTVTFDNTLNDMDFGLTWGASHSLIHIDPINNKQNQRDYKIITNLAGKITGYRNGSADGKLGGILYFEKYGIYCLVYAKTPNVSEDSYNGKILFI